MKSYLGIIIRQPANMRVSSAKDNEESKIPGSLKKSESTKEKVKLEASQTYPATKDNQKMGMHRNTKTERNTRANTE